MPAISLLEQAGERSPDSVVPLLIGRLRELGATVDVWVPEQEPSALHHVPLEADLYVWKSHGPLCDSVAAFLHASGRPLINDYFGTLQVRDKIVTAKRLMDAGLPTPAAYWAESMAQLRTVVCSYPIVVKPNAGRRGEQIRVVQDAEELDRLPEPEGSIFAQQHVQGTGLDLKAYVIGQQVFGVMRPFPPKTAAEKRGQPCAVSAEVRELCLRCGELFGLELFGVDIMETPDGPYVIEINCFPGYKGVPEAEHLLADYLLRAAKESN